MGHGNESLYEWSVLSVNLIATNVYLSRLMTKPTKWHVCPAKTQISLGIRQVWSESSLSAWTKLGSLATHWAHSEDSNQTGWMPRLIWVFAGCTVILLVLSWGGSFLFSGSCSLWSCFIFTPWRFWSSKNKKTFIYICCCSPYRCYSHILWIKSGRVTFLILF